MSHWADSYIGIPFESDGRTRAGCDCWGLVRIFYQEHLSISLPDYAGTLHCADICKLMRIASIIKKESKRWIFAEKYQPIDIILLRDGAFPGHVGIVIDKRNMLHTSAKLGESIIESFLSPQYCDKIVGFYRYAG